MRTITTETNVYSFEELSEGGKQKAISNLYDINVDHDWWSFIYDDAKNIGLKITEFDTDRASLCRGHFINSAEETAHKIEKEHGDSCATYQAAKHYLGERDDLVAKYSDGINTEVVHEDNETEFDCDCDELDKEFLDYLLTDYLKILRDEVEYQMSEEAIIETIEANEYEFTEDGKLY